MCEGLGILLIVVISIGWRCTPAGHEPCHLLFNFEQCFNTSDSQRAGRPDRCRDRSLDQNQWFGGMLTTTVPSFFMSFVYAISALLL